MNILIESGGEGDMGSDRILEGRVEKKNVSGYAVLHRGKRSGVAAQEVQYLCGMGVFD